MPPPLDQGSASAIVVKIAARFSPSIWKAMIDASAISAAISPYWIAVAPRVFEEIADLAIEYKSGARSLRGLFEEVMTPVLYAVPDHPEIRRVEIASLFTEPRYFRSAPPQ